MEDINCIKLVLVEKKRTARWLSQQMGVNPSTLPGTDGRPEIVRLKGKEMATGKADS